LTIAFVGMLLAPHSGLAAEAGQGTFYGALVPGVGCGPDHPATLLYWSHFTFDDKEFVINDPPGNNLLHVNFGDLGPFSSTGTLDCVFDVGGTFVSTASNDAGDFQWIDLNGEYLDHKPDIAEGDPFPWVASARCVTTRTDDFKTLCDNFVLSWNGLSKMKAPTPEGGYNEFEGHLNVRTAQKVPVDKNPDHPTGAVDVSALVDGPGGAVPDVAVRFANGVLGPGELSISTLADAHGAVPSDTEFPVRGTTQLDHGAGPVPFFPGGDERFIDIATDAPLPASAKLEVCLPLPIVTAPSDVRPARILHGEGDTLARTFVDRTSRLDRPASKVCARVSSLSKFAVVTRDVCGNGQKSYDGIVTIAGGLVGRKNVIVDGVSDCAAYPADLPPGLARDCIPDADTTSGQCSVSLKLGVNRATCNAHRGESSDVYPSSYVATVKGTNGAATVSTLFQSALSTLPDHVDEITVPVTIALPVSGAVTKYKWRQSMQGLRPGSGDWVTDKDSVTITCLDPTQF
jgi:hypothetical protein